MIFSGKLNFYNCPWYHPWVQLHPKVVSLHYQKLAANDRYEATCFLGLLSKKNYSPPAIKHKPSFAVWFEDLGHMTLPNATVSWYFWICPENRDGIHTHYTYSFITKLTSDIWFPVSVHILLPNLILTNYYDISRSLLAAWASTHLWNLCICICSRVHNAY